MCVCQCCHGYFCVRKKESVGTAPPLLPSLPVSPSPLATPTFLSFRLSDNQMPFSHINTVLDSQQFSTNYLFLSIHSPFSFEPLIWTGLSSTLHLFPLTCSWYSIPMLRVLTRIAIMIPRLKYLLSTILFSFSLKPIQARTTPFLYPTTPRRLLRPRPPLRSPP